MTDTTTNRIVIEGDAYYAPVHNQLELDTGPDNARKWVNVVDAIVQTFALQMYASDSRLRIIVERIKDKEQNAPSL